MAEVLKKRLYISQKNLKSSKQALTSGESSICNEHWKSIQSLYGSEKNAIKKLNITDKRSLKK